MENPFDVSVSYGKLEDIYPAPDVVDAPEEKNVVENVQQQEEGAIEEGATQVVSEDGAGEKSEGIEEGDAIPSTSNTPPTEDVGYVDVNKINPYFAGALHLKEQGIIPEDYELPEDVKWDDIEPFYETKVKSKVMQEVERELALEGITEDELRFARMKSRGVDPEQFNVANRLRAVASLKDAGEVSKENKLAAIQSMYEFRQVPKEEYEVLIKNAQGGDESFDALFNKSVTFHEENYGAFKENERQQHEAHTQALKQQAQQNEAKLSKIFRDKKAGKVSFSDSQSEALKRAIYDKTIQVDDGAGNKVAVSEMWKFINDFQSDDELKVELYMLRKYRKEVEAANVGKAKRDIEKELIQAARGSSIKEEEKPSENNSGYKLPTARSYQR